MISIHNQLFELRSFYSRHGRRDKVIAVHVKNKIYLLTKKQIVEFLMKLTSDEREFDDFLFKTLFKHLNDNVRSMEEDHWCNEIRESYKNYLVSQIYNINDIRKNPHLINIMKRNRETKEQFDRFKSFNCNQDKFDNMISVLKIIRRLNESHININLDFDFDLNEEDNSFNFVKDIVEYNLNDFKNLIFIL